MVQETQEKIFRLIGSAGLSGGFAIGTCLPKEKGNLKDFMVVHITSVKGENINKLVSRLIETLGEKPKRNLEARARQLKELVKGITAKGKMFIVVIKKAHYLSSRTLYNLKAIHEFGTKKGTYPGFILLGNKTQLMKLLNSEPGIKLRTLVLEDIAKK